MEKLIFGLTLMDNNEITEELSLESLKCLEDDLTEFVEELAEELLSQHQIHSDVINPACGCWYVNFSWKKDELPISEEEQIESIIQAGERLVREYLENQIEEIDKEIDFELVIYPLSDKVERLDQEARCELILKQKTKNFSIDIKREELVEVIENQKIDIYLQPILNLESQEVVGFEALARGPEDSLIHNPANLFGTASQYGLTEELELACVKEAIKLLDSLPESYWLSINLGPDLLKTERLMDDLEKVKKSNLNRVVLELTEHLPLSDIEEIKQPVRSLQQKGIKLALDDTGCGFANLDVISQLQP